MKIFLIVEGPSDKIIFKGQNNWFDSLGIESEISPTYGKGKMVKAAEKYYKIARYQNANYIIFLPDQNSDACALVTRQKIGMNSYNKAVTIVMKLQMEAWILADSQCLRDSIRIHYSPAGITDVMVNPKLKLFSIMKNKLGYRPGEVEAAYIAAPHFSIERAAKHNNSARRFKEFIESIAEK